MSCHCMQRQPKGMQTAWPGMGRNPCLDCERSTADDLFEVAVHAAEEAGYIQKGDKVVLTAGVPLGVSGNTNMIRVVEV